MVQMHAVAASWHCSKYLLKPYLLLACTKQKVCEMKSCKCHSVNDVTTSKIPRGSSDHFFCALFALIDFPTLSSSNKQSIQRR